MSFLGGKFKRQPKEKRKGRRGNYTLLFAFSILLIFGLLWFLLINAPKDTLPQATRTLAPTSEPVIDTATPIVIPKLTGIATAFAPPKPSPTPLILQPVRTIKNSQQPVESVVFSLHGDTILAANADGTAKIWKWQLSQLVSTINAGGMLLSAVYSPDARNILIAGFIDVSLWDAANGQKIQSYVGVPQNMAANGMPRESQGIAFSPDGKYIAAGANDNTAILWDVTKPDPLRVFTGHTAQIAAVAFSPDGTMLLTGSWDHTAKVWDVATGKLIRTFVGHTDIVSGVAFSPDGNTILTGSRDHTAKLWDVATGNLLRTFIGHTDRIVSVAFSPDGKLVLTSSGWADNAARLWDVTTGNNIAILNGPSAVAGYDPVVMSVAFGPDSKLILTGNSDGSIMLWSTVCCLSTELTQ